MQDHCLSLFSNRLLQGMQLGMQNKLRCGVLMVKDEDLHCCSRDIDLAD